MALFERENDDFGSDVATRALSVTAVENQFVERVYEKLANVYDLVFGPTLHPGRLVAIERMGIAAHRDNPVFIHVVPQEEALAKARVAQGPLAGVPFAVKDNIDVAGLVNSAGSLALADHRPAADAFIAARLRAAGAVILGKTNLSEWANFRSTKSSSGWSSGWANPSSWFPTAWKKCTRAWARCSSWRWASATSSAC